MSPTLGLSILGLGAAIPEPVRLNDAWPESFHRRFDESRKHDITTIERGAGGETQELDRAISDAMAPYATDPFRGTRRRHITPAELPASDLEADAARRAIADAGLTAADIDVAFIASYMPDMLMPSNGPALQAKVGLVNAICYPTDLACASFLGHLVLADALIAAGRARYVLSVNSGTLSRFLDLNLPVSVHIGDGASACVFGASGRAGFGLLGQHARTDGSLRDGIVLAHVGADGKPARRYEDAAARIVFTTLDPAAGKAGGQKGAAWCRESCAAAMAQAGVSLGDISLYFGAQSLKWFPDACRRALGLSPEQVIESFDEVANIGPATIPYNLLLARQRGLLRDGALLLLYSPGIGMHRLAVVLRWSA